MICLHVRACEIELNSDCVLFGLLRHLDSLYVVLFIKCLTFELAPKFQLVTESLVDLIGLLSGVSAHILLSDPRGDGG